MSDSTENNLGRRRYLLHQEKAVEYALERIRRAPHSGWETLSSAERAALKAVLTEIWENCESKRWEQYCFSTLAKPDIQRLIALGDEVRGRHQQICDAREEFEAILLSCSLDNHPH